MLYQSLSFVGSHPKHESDMQMPWSKWVLLVNHVLAAIGTFQKSGRSSARQIWRRHTGQNHPTGTIKSAQKGQ